MRGYIDKCTRTEIAGWAITDQAEVAELVVEVDAEILGVVRAAIFREDLDRHCGFRLSLDAPLADPRKVRVYFADTKTDLENSPFDFKHRLLQISAEDAAWAEGFTLPPVGDWRAFEIESSEQFVAEASRAAIAIADHIVEFFGVFDPALRILDLGCGIGRALAPLSRKHKGTWFGCDQDARAIEFLRRVAPQAETVPIEADLRLPYPDDTFDGVIALSLWIHSPIGAQLPWLAEAKRVLRKGGLALIATAGSRAVDVRRQRDAPGWSDIFAADLEAAGIIYRSERAAPGSAAGRRQGLCAHDPAHVQRVWSTTMPVLKTSECAIEAIHDLHVLTKL